MLDIFLQITDLIAPPPKAVKALRRETTDTFLRYFAPRRIAHTIALCNYTESKVRACIMANKFHDHQKAALLLATLLSHWLNTLPKKPTILVPIPLSKQRQRERGYNQVTRVLEKLPQESFAIYHLIERPIDTAPQTSLAREERFKNMVDVFTLKPHREDLSGFRIIIVDDVTTTGATLHSAVSVLKPKLPRDCEVICLALAH